jgi:hypothetical protein
VPSTTSQSGSTDPAVNPNAPTSTNPAASSPQVNLGPDPNIGAPALESTPTAQMILSPLLNLFPTLKNFVVPSHPSECPRPAITLFNKSLVLDCHCALLESVRPTLYAVMTFVWAVVALMIILAA